MARDLEHLDLLRVGSSESPSRRGTVHPPDRDRVQFAKRALRSIREIVVDHESPKRRLVGRELDLLFKMRVHQYGGREVKKSLRQADCHTLVARPDERHPWIVRANDKRLTRLQDDIKESVAKKSTYVDNIEEFSILDPEEKFGELLRENPIKEAGSDYVVVEILKKPDNDGNDLRDDTLAMIRGLAAEHGFSVRDEFVSENVCQVLVMANNSLLRALSLVDYVYMIDRRPEYQLSQAMANPLDVDNVKTFYPPRDAHGILVLDTGMVRHPLLEKAIREDFFLSSNKHDTKSHGTQVGGIAAYADLKSCIDNATFRPEVHVCSGQLFYDDASTGDYGIEGKEIVTQTDRAKKKFPKCRVVNLSIYSKRSGVMDGLQPTLAMTIDDLSSKHKDMVFVVAAGNVLKGEKSPHKSYAGLSTKELRGAMLLDPATSVHALTVGGVMRDRRPNTYVPSPSSRMGSGINGAIKPDLVEIGGGEHDRVITLSNTPNQSLFKLSAGTSFSAPIVANYAARLMNRFPSASRNLIAALLISSATLPARKPELGRRTQQERNALLLHIYGHGRPSLPDAMHSGQDRVVLTHDGKIKPGSALYFSIPLPAGFFQTPGFRTISVTLSFDPPCSRDEPSYMGTQMEFKVFANRPVADVIRACESVARSGSPRNGDAGSSAVLAQRDPKPKPVEMNPGPRLRKRTNHQKGTHTSTRRLQTHTKHPLILAVSCTQTWDSPASDEQAFSAVVSVEHRGIDLLYDKVREAHQSYVRVRQASPAG